MGKAYITFQVILMVRDMRDTGKMIRSMDMEYTIFQVILMVKDIMDNGKMV
jgi:hypothetical protein